jgi:hypothetical protein
MVQVFRYVLFKSFYIQSNRKKGFGKYFFSASRIKVSKGLHAAREPQFDYICYIIPLSDNNGDYCLLRYHAVLSGGSVTTFCRNMVFPSSG